MDGNNKVKRLKINKDQKVKRKLDTFTKLQRFLAQL
mgnify:CR=1 FL=1|jgi:hypothetical protein